MDNGEIVNQLGQLGLTGYEARAYLALTARDSCTAAEVARLAEVPRQRIYDVLGSLVTKGLATLHPGASARYAATDPHQGLDRLMEAQRHRLAELERQTVALLEEMEPLYHAGQEHTDPLDYIQVLREPGAINACFDELQASVQREILVFNKPPYARPPQDNVKGLAVAREARSLYEYSLFEDLAATEGVRRFVRAGEQARVVPELPLKLVIIDEAVVLFGMQDPVAGRTDLTIGVVRHPSLAAVLKVAFNAYWEHARSFDQAYDEFLRKS